VGSSTETLVAYSDILTLQPDIVFINSSLPKLNLEKLDFVSSFIYTADAPHFAAEAFENNAVDYLMKPFSQERFSKCITKVKLKQFEGRGEIIQDKSSHSDYFFVRNEARGNKVIRIKYDEIIYIEASQNYVTIHLANKSHLIYLTMKEVEDFLPSDRFIRVHKSYLINEQKISAIDGNKITLDDTFTIIYGVSYKKELFSKVNPKLITSKRRMGVNDILEEGYGRE
jgi:DNA-binding LytR/AlgR family response regulator